MDLSLYERISIGGVEMKTLAIDGVQIWRQRIFTNQVPISTDTDGSVFNGVGYKENVRLSSSGGISSSAQNGTVTTGFIPFGGDTDVIRIKGVEWKSTTANYGGHYYISFYDSDKKHLTYLAAESYDSGDWDHVISVTRNEATGVETFDFNENYGTTNLFLQDVRQASFFRISARGQGANFIVTVNEEI